ncbi:TPA: hypothetical protein ACSTL5_003603 [Serratia fonticola]
MTDKFELDKKFQSLPERAQVCAAEALRNALSQGVDADAQSSEQIGRNIKKAFIALFEGEGDASKIDIQIGSISINTPGLCVTGSLRSNINVNKDTKNSSR